MAITTKSYLREISESFGVIFVRFGEASTSKLNQRPLLESRASRACAVGSQTRCLCLFYHL